MVPLALRFVPGERVSQAVVARPEVHSASVSSSEISACVFHVFLYVYEQWQEKRTSACYDKIVEPDRQADKH